MKNTFLAIDLTEGSGSAVLGELTDGLLSLREIHSFTHKPLYADGHGYWNIALLYQEIRKSLGIAADRDLPVESIGITTWGADFALMGEDGVPMPPFIGRDVKNEGSVEAFTARMSADKIFGQTGTQLSKTNSLFQLSALKQMGYEPLKKAKHLLFMPDIFNYMLTGVILTEFSMAATSQLYNPVKRMWDHDLFRTLGVPVSIMPRIVEPGSIVGSISNNVSYETGIARIPVVAVASHQVASVVAGLPAVADNRAFLIAGSRCVMGFESPTAVITKKSQQLNFTNWGGAGHVFLVHKNLAGLGLVDECLRNWTDFNYTMAGMIAMAADAEAFAAFIDTDHPSFLNPDDLPGAVTEYCKSTGQNVPSTHGGIIRTILEGLAFKFRIITRQIETLSGSMPEMVNITGDGSNIELLCRFTANCCGIPVVASNSETAAAGNILVQAMALGIIKNTSEIREITERSFPSKNYEPADVEIWNAAFRKYLLIVN